MLYELTIIAPESISDEGIHEIKRTIRKHTTSVEKFEDDGVKRLAYTIKGHDRGRYLFWYIGLPYEEPAKLSSELNLNDHVLRYLLVKADVRGK